MLYCGSRYRVPKCVQLRFNRKLYLTTGYKTDRQIDRLLGVLGMFAVVITASMTAFVSNPPIYNAVEQIEVRCGNCSVC